MAFKLTVLLAGAILLAMMLAPEGPEITEPVAKAPQETIPEPPAPETREAPEPPEETVRIEPTEEPSQPQVDRDAVASALDEAQSDVTAEETEETARVLDGLSAGSIALTGTAIEALSLADSVRARTETPEPSRRIPEQLDLSPQVETITVAPVEGQQVAATPSLPISIVTATSVNLRAGPSTAETVVGRVSQGDRVEVIGPSATGWTGIRHPERGDTVYMASQFLEPAN